MSENKYIPALRFKLLTPLFDWVLSSFMKEKTIKMELINQLNLIGNEKILDFGCGTGTLAIMMKRLKPDCIINGLDVDEQILGIAEKKAIDEALNINFKKYDGVTLPYEDESFDKVTTSLVFHHLSLENKYSILKEIKRVLKRGGELHILDYGIQRTSYTKFITNILKHTEPIQDNIDGKLIYYMEKSGFTSVKEKSFINTLLGAVSFYSSKKSV